MLSARTITLVLHTVCYPPPPRLFVEIGGFEASDELPCTRARIIYDVWVQLLFCCLVSLKTIELSKLEGGQVINKLSDFPGNELSCSVHFKLMQDVASGEYQFCEIPFHVNAAVEECGAGNNTLKAACEKNLPLCRKWVKWSLKVLLSDLKDVKMKEECKTSISQKIFCVHGRSIQI